MLDPQKKWEKDHLYNFINLKQINELEILN